MVLLPSPVSNSIVTGGGFRIPYEASWADGSYNIGDELSVSVPESRETMTDVIGNRGGHNSVTHSRKTMSYSDAQAPVYRCENTVSPYGTCVQTCKRGAAALLSHASTWAHCSVPDGLAVAKARVPLVGKREMDGLVELYETKDLISSLSRVQSVLMNAEYGRRTLRTGRTQSVAREILREFASSPSEFLSSLVDVHLGYKFALRPLFEAVQGVQSALGRIDSVAQKVSKPFSVHGSFTTDKTETYVPAVWSGAGASLGLFESRGSLRKTTKVTWTYTVVRRMRPDKLPQIDRLRLAAVLDSLGLKPSLSAVWAAIPRSFIVDWFFPIREYLEQLDGNNASSEWFDTLNTYSSTKTRTTGAVIEEFRPRADYWVKTKLDAGTEYHRHEFTHTEYNRGTYSGIIEAPQQIYVPLPRVPSFGQMGTITEMLFQGSYKAFRVKGPTLVGK